MTQLTAKTLIDLLKFDQDVIHMQMDGITHADSLLQPPFRGNCLNWVVGHILDGRHDWLGLLEMPAMMSEEERHCYGYGSEPITSEDQACQLESLLDRLDQVLAVLVGKLETLSQAELDREVEIWRGRMPLSQALMFFMWHDTYHTGQLEQLRQLAGKNDKVI